jgi:hypothetical protein
MAADIVNLRRVRKAKSRAERERQADENRVRFGRTKGEKSQAKAEKIRSDATHDRHRRETDDRTD